MGVWAAVSLAAVAPLDGPLPPERAPRLAPRVRDPGDRVLRLRARRATSTCTRGGRRRCSSPSRPRTRSSPRRSSPSRSPGTGTRAGGSGTCSCWPRSRSSPGSRAASGATSASPTSTWTRRRGRRAAGQRPLRRSRGLHRVLRRAPIPATCPRCSTRTSRVGVPADRASTAARSNKLIGDAIMAVFNERGDQPDHAERAVRAGLALQETAGRVAREHPELAALPRRREHGRRARRRGRRGRRPRVHGARRRREPRLPARGPGRARARS